MTTLDSYAFISAQTLGKDLYLRYKNTSDDKKINLSVKIGLVISTLLSIFLSILIPSVINIWYTIGTVIIPGLLIPIVASYFPKMKINSNQAFLIMLTGFFSSLFCLSWGYIFSAGGSPQYPFGIEPMYIGLISTLILFILFKSKKHTS
jgi:SSS family solute:Na+ symporter